MNMPYVAWLLILFFLVISFILRTNPDLNFLVPDEIWNLFALVLWLLFVFTKGREKIGNHRDFMKRSHRDENHKINEVAQDMAKRGLTFSSMRTDSETRVRDDFEYERRKNRRALWRDLFETLLLK